MALGNCLSLPFRRAGLGVSAGGGGAWSPAELAVTIDYGKWDDFTRLRTASAGTGSDPVENDPIGYYRGQLDVLEFRQPYGDGYKPYLGPDGIVFGPTSYRFLLATLSKTYDADIGLFLHAADQATSGKSLALSLSLGEFDGSWTGIDADAGGPPGIHAHDRGGAATNLGSATDDDAILFNRSAGVATARLNDGSFQSITAGGNTSTTSLILMGNWLGGASPISRRWCVTSGPVTGDDADLMAAWLKG